MRRYSFSADGAYDYILGVCVSSTDCTIQYSESGQVRSSNGVLSFAPQTEPSEGERAYPYRVGRLTAVGDVQLHMSLPDGQIDIFYWDGY
jgi:hypothetical protein